MCTGVNPVEKRSSRREVISWHRLLGCRLTVIISPKVHNHGDITVSTGYGNGVSHVKVRPGHSITRSVSPSATPLLTHSFTFCFQLKTVYYQTTVSFQNCNFDFNIEITKASEYSAIVGACLSPSANK